MLSNYQIDKSDMEELLLNLCKIRIELSNALDRISKIMTSQLQSDSRWTPEPPENMLGGEGQSVDVYAVNFNRYIPIHEKNNRALCIIVTTQDGAILKERVYVSQGFKKYDPIFDSVKETISFIKNNINNQTEITLMVPKYVYKILNVSYPSLLPDENINMATIETECETKAAIYQKAKDIAREAIS
jgi:hypothetical protein